MNHSQVVSVHFPKAGGTSIATQFIRLLPGQVELDYTHDPLVEHGREQAPFPPGKRIVHGHFAAARYAGSTEAVWVTFLREPVDNLISIFDFWLAYPEHGNPVHARFLRERPSLVEFAAYAGIGNLMSQTYFAGFDMGRFDLIGFFETREQDIGRLASLLSLPLDPAVHENRTRLSVGRAMADITASVRDRLRDLLADDLAFYDRLRRRA